MATQRQKKSPMDATGAKRDQLQKEHEAELARRQAELTMQAQVEAQSDEVTDYSGEEGPLTMDVDEPDEAVEWQTVGEAPVQEQGQLDEGKAVVIRVNTDLEDVTIGVGNNYSFYEGQRYRVPLHVAQHLEEKGYVWH